MAKKVILDMDPGIDDALAIMLAIRSSELEVLMVSTVSGNVHVDLGSLNALKILDFMGRRDIPVAKGAGKPLLKPLETGEWVHGKDGLGGVGLPVPEVAKLLEGKAPDLIAELVSRHASGDITLIATGPLTNAAIVLLKEPSLARMLREIVVMGGAYGVTPYGYGNRTPASEYNLWADPEAAKIVFESGAKLTAVGLDVTMDPEAVITKELYEEIRKAGTRTSELVSRMMANLMDRVGFFALHDPMAVAYAIDRSLFEIEPYHVEVVTGDGTIRGQTIADRRVWLPPEFRQPPNLNLCVKVDGPRFLELFMDRVIRR